MITFNLLRNAKFCRWCKSHKLKTEFYAWNNVTCRSCYLKRGRLTSKVRARRSHLKHRQGRMDETRQLKTFVINSLGGVCACCGISEIELLTIDHLGPRGTGAKHRRETCNNRYLYKDIIRQGLPRDKFRVMCFNCNISLGIFGYCPHDKIACDLERIMCA